MVSACDPKLCTWPSCEGQECPYNDPRLAVMEAEAMLGLDWGPEVWGD